jgi:glycosyltransferase involved in cell wall biosynthesis
MSYVAAGSESGPADWPNPNVRFFREIACAFGYHARMALALKVLFLCPQPFFQWRGSPIRVGFDVMALAELGFEVDLLTMPVGAPREIPGVRILRVPNVVFARDLPIGPSVPKALLDGLILLRGAALTLRRRYDVFHGVEEAGALAVFLSRLRGGKVVYEKHSDPASHRTRGLKNLVLSAYARVERFTLRRADAVIVTGPGLESQSRLVCPAGRVFAIGDIPSSLVEADPARAEAARRAWGAGPGDVVALYVGSFAPYQGIDLLFEALPAAAASAPGLRVVVIGGSPEDIRARRERAVAGGYADRLVFAGHVAPDELPHLLSAADILLSPRLSGLNTPLKLLDYMKAGRAIAAADTTPNRLLLDERCAVFAPPQPAAYAAAIAGLARDPGRRAELGRRARQLVDTTHNYPAFKARLDACYASLKLPGRGSVEGRGA